MKEKLCKCGCKQKLDFTTGRRNKNYIHGHRVNISNEGAIARKGTRPWNKGVPRTDEEKETISIAIIGGGNAKGCNSPEHARNISNALKGKIKSKEWCDNISRGQKKRYRKQEEHDKISRGVKKAYREGRLTSSFYIDGRWKNDPESDFNQYGGKFTYYLKQKIRLKYKRICQLCGAKNSKEVHHIDHDKLNNLESNLIVLCKKCHHTYHLHSTDIQQKEKQTLLQKRL